MSVTLEQVSALFDKPLFDLLLEAQAIHRQHHDPGVVQCSTLLSIKTGACPEDCGYCSQSAHHNTGLLAEPLMPLDEVVEAAKEAKASGSTRFCMGAAWRRVPDNDLPKLTEMISTVKALGLETCVTLGSITPTQAQAFKEAGLDYYNHNLDTSEAHYGNVISTRPFAERLQTLENVRDAGINVCCGGIVGLGETQQDRAALLATLASMDPPPESVPINNLVTIEGTPLADQGVTPVDKFTFVKTIAVARLVMPASMIRLSAGRESMSEELQALCFLAGANSIFVGDKLLTTGNRGSVKDHDLLKKIDLVPARV